MVSGAVELAKCETGFFFCYFVVDFGGGVVFVVVFVVGRLRRDRRTRVGGVKEKGERGEGGRKKRERIN